MYSGSVKVDVCIVFFQAEDGIRDLVRSRGLGDVYKRQGVQVREDSVPAIIQAKQVVECIRLLPIGYRTVLNLYAVEGYSHREISNMLDIEESTSRSQYTRAKAMLEDILVRKKILQKPKQQTDWLAAVGQR